MSRECTREGIWVATASSTRVHSDIRACLSLIAARLMGELLAASVPEVDSRE